MQRFVRFVFERGGDFAHVLAVAAALALVAIFVVLLVRRRSAAAAERALDAAIAASRKGRLEELRASASRRPGRTWRIVSAALAGRPDDVGLAQPQAWVPVVFVVLLGLSPLFVAQLGEALQARDVLSSAQQVSPELRTVTLAISLEFAQSLRGFGAFLSALLVIPTLLVVAWLLALAGAERRRRGLVVTHLRAAAVGVAQPRG